MQIFSPPLLLIFHLVAAAAAAYEDWNVNEITTTIYLFRFFFWF